MDGIYKIDSVNDHNEMFKIHSFAIEKKNYLNHTQKL